MGKESKGFVLYAAIVLVLVSGWGEACCGRGDFGDAIERHRAERVV